MTNQGTEGEKPIVAAMEIDKARFDEVMVLQQKAFGEGAFPADKLLRLLNNPENVNIGLVGPDKKMIGFANAIPEMAGNAYISCVVLDESVRGVGLVADLMRAMEERLKSRGFDCFTIDADVENGFADKLKSAYGERLISEGKVFGAGSTKQVHLKIKL